MLSQRVFLSFVIFVSVVSVTVLPGCAKSENKVVEPTPQEVLDADEAKGPVEAAKI